ncbi:MAG TPA: hypothetical protein VFS43_48030 [Polyangiaceae bacterium]|nr:hypothetical protein [Polyangiaceae bacterium]
MPPYVPRSLALAIACAAALVAGCGAETFRDSRYEGQGLAFRVGPRPPSWTRLETSHGLLAFRDEGLNATVLVNGRCGVDGDDVPLPALTRHLFLQFTEREVEEERLLPFDGREALSTTLRAKLDGVPKRFTALVLKKDGCVYDFVLVSEPGSFPRARADFDRFVMGFHTEKP